MTEWVVPLSDIIQQGVVKGQHNNSVLRGKGRTGRRSYRRSALPRYRIWLGSNAHR